MSQCLWKQFISKEWNWILHIIFNIIVSEVCRLFDQSENTVFLALASISRVEISVAITLASAVKETKQ